ncbi:MAG: transcriptional repressor [Firmicutes bacterium]|nr:transcriptional repressor [Bacillota bacterium]
MKLYNSGIKLTSSREAVLSVFCENFNKHLSAEEVYELAKLKMPSIGVATVYRSINIFVISQLVAKIQFMDKVTRYELLDKNNMHYHLYCEDCGGIIEEPISRIKVLETEISKEVGFQLTAANSCLIGKCQKCLLKKKKR